MGVGKQVQSKESAAILSWVRSSKQRMGKQGRTPHPQF